jgi:PhoH-like ATPase
MTKKLVFDTNVLLHDPNCIYNFPNCDIIIPSFILEELDNMKKSQDKLGYTAREILRNLEKLTEKGFLCDGINITETSKIFVINENLILDIDKAKVDNKLLYFVKQFGLLNKENVILITKDINLRIKANAEKVQCTDYEFDKDNTKIDANQEIKSIILEPEILDELYNKKRPDFDFEVKDLLINEYFTFEDALNSKRKMLCRYLGNNKIKKINTQLSAINIKPRNLEQNFLFDCLLDEKIKLVLIQGLAGTGKTLIATVCAVKQILEETYESLYISKSILPVGGKNNELGFLPGTLEEKLNPAYQSFVDSLRVIKLSDAKSKKSALPAGFEKCIEFLPLTFLRGRSLGGGGSGALVILDEAQNCTTHEIKTLISRASDKCKIIILADCDQIDNFFVDKYSNGFIKTVHAFKNQEIAAYINLTKCERSELCELATKLL